MTCIVCDCSYKLNTFPLSKGNSTNCNAALRSIDKELLEIETALDAFEALVEKERKLLDQGEVQLYIHTFSLKYEACKILQNQYYVLVMLVLSCLIEYTELSPIQCIMTVFKICMLRSDTLWSSNQCVVFFSLTNTCNMQFSISRVKIWK